MFIFKLLLIRIVDKLAILKGGGSSLAGYVSLKLKFNLMKKVDLSKVNIIFVIGTNGKTTTANMISDGLTSNYRVINNREGANLLAGILTIIYRHLRFNQTIDADFLVLEVDEKTVSQIMEYFKPNHVVITNFFRDQLDRYGEIDSIVQQIISAINDSNITVHLNGCDPLMMYKFRNNINPIKLYGLNETSKSTKIQNKIVELKYCPNCLTKLNYDFYHYGHIGHYNCQCGFKQKELDCILDVDFKHNNIKINNQAIDLNTNEYPLYYYFNIAACASILTEFDQQYISLVKQIFTNFKFPKGRSQVFIKDQRKIYLNLVKNVVGFEETIDYINQEFVNADLLILFNDNYADGRDVSWIWDTHIISLIENIDRVYISGTRRYDMALRFEFEGMENIHVIDLDEALATKEVLEQTSGNLAIISNYTPLAKVSRTLNEYVGEK